MISGQHDPSRTKDLFSQQAKDYARYRPTYPKELFEYILKFVPERDCAWDCATGNGQAAETLSKWFKRVEATDLSKAQLQHAILKDNINYSVSPAEKTAFADNSFDLITVAQAYHWLQWDKFGEEAKRVGKKNGIVAIWGYNLFTSTVPALNTLLERFYHDIVGPYWDAERRFVDDRYETVSFPFRALPSNYFETGLMWQKDDLIGYLSSWSSVQHYVNKHQISPIALIRDEIEAIWHDKEQLRVVFPIFLRLGMIDK